MRKKYTIKLPFFYCSNLLTTQYHFHCLENFYPDKFRNGVHKKGVVINAINKISYHFTQIGVTTKMKFSLLLLTLYLVGSCRQMMNLSKTKAHFQVQPFI